jgi:hypothetical protein
LDYCHADVVWKTASPYGRRELHLLARHDGLFEFRENVLTLLDHAQGSEEVWLPGYSSGLFRTPGEAEREARNAIGWLRVA